MNMNYLISILNLYLSKENNNSLIVELNNVNDSIKIELSYSNSYRDKTYIKLNKDIFFKDVKLFVLKIQNNLTIKEELIENNKYSIVFSNNRKVSFVNFSASDIELIRANVNFMNYESLYNLNINTSDNVSIDESSSYEEIYKENKQSNLKFSFGFTSFITILLTSVWFLDIFMIALWIFKALR